MFDSFSQEILRLKQRHDHISLEEHIENICIVRLSACSNYLNIPSISRITEQDLKTDKLMQRNSDTEQQKTGPEQKQGEKREILEVNQKPTELIFEKIANDEF